MFRLCGSEDPFNENVASARNGDVPRVQAGYLSNTVRRSTSNMIVLCKPVSVCKHSKQENTHSTHMFNKFVCDAVDPLFCDFKTCGVLENSTSQSNLISASIILDVRIRVNTIPPSLSQQSWLRDSNVLSQLCSTLMELYFCTVSTYAVRMDLTWLENQRSGHVQATPPYLSPVREISRHFTGRVM